MFSPTDIWLRQDTASAGIVRHVVNGTPIDTSFPAAPWKNPRLLTVDAKGHAFVVATNDGDAAILGLQGSTWSVALDVPGQPYVFGGVTKLASGTPSWFVNTYPETSGDMKVLAWYGAQWVRTTRHLKGSGVRLVSDGDRVVLGASGRRIQIFHQACSE